MLTNAWLQQRNRTITTLANGEQAVVVEAEDYRVAYEVFKDAATRSLDNIGEKHVKILNALYELQETDSRRVRDKGFSLRKIADKAGDGINHELVRTQKGFLMNLGFVIEDDRGSLKLIEGAEPSSWGGGKSLSGFPDPAEIIKRWGASKIPDNLTNAPDTYQKPIDNTDSLSDSDLTNALTDGALSGELSDEKTEVTPDTLPIGKPTPNGNGKVSGLTGVFEASDKVFKKGETALGSYKTNSRG